MADLARTYQKKTDREHVLDNPEPYTGAMQLTPCQTYVRTDNGVERKTITYIPGLYKLFDEGVVNARDHYVRQSEKIAAGKPAVPVTKIEINITEDGVISILNNGDGIDIAKHPEHKMWIPEMIFGHLRTSSNYDTAKDRIGGGRNGLGFKLALIWSTEGSVDTVDHTRQLRYRQEFTDNLSTIGPSRVTSSKHTPYTLVTFKPDYKRLGVAGIDGDLMALFHRRACDIAAVTPASVCVKFNGSRVGNSNFQQYVDLYRGPRDASPRAYERPHSRWEYAVGLSDSGEFQQVSLVNGIFTNNGGKHVEYILGQIVRALQAHALACHKTTLKPSSIKEQLSLYLRCDIVNPIFNSQTKECLMTVPSKFGSACQVSDKFIKQLIKLGVTDTACAITALNEKRALSKHNGAKTSTISGIPKLVDAQKAGTKDHHLTTLLVVEGDSAKAGVLSGLSKEGRAIYGIYPLKGKLMNVRGETQGRIAGNKEIADIKKILGLEIGKEYKTKEDMDSLRYGRLLILTDQDLDGTHIKALCVNLLHAEWKSLTHASNFIGFMSTPIIRVTKGAAQHTFYTQQEYALWKETQDTKGWHAKYYKGLGTSTAKEFKEYFHDQRTIMFEHSGEGCDGAIDMVFNKTAAPARKDWLRQYDPNLTVPPEAGELSYCEFINKEVIHFSKYDCERSIPNMMDGLKTSQRKVLFGFFKKNQKAEVKVAQMSGYISEHSCYHHGENSLNSTIIGMAQDYAGSNNINLLSPNGQFGTRLQGGKDAASERYIFTQLSSLTKLIFRKEDESVLTCLEDDGQPVEPEWYAPIIPMLLINGSRGIGTGFSTNIPPCDPLAVIAYVKAAISGAVPGDLVPWHRGFKRPLEKLSDTKYLARSCYSRVAPDKLRVTDLCVGYWTDDFKALLEKLMAVEKKKRVVRSYDDISTDREVDITVTFQKGTLAGLLVAGSDGRTGAEKLLKLTANISLTNMHAFNSKQKLQAFPSLGTIADEYIGVRLAKYERRKAAQLRRLMCELTELQARKQFVELVVSGELSIMKMAEEQLIEKLDALHLPKRNESYDYLLEHARSHAHGG